MLVLALANVLFICWSRRSVTGTERQIVAQILTDLTILTAVLHFSGGLENPLYIFYTFHVIISCILLGNRRGYLFTGIACAAFSLLVLGELLQVLPHYTVHLFPHSHVQVEHAAHDSLYALSRAIAFVLILVGTAFFTNLIMNQLLQSESNLQQMAYTATTERQKLESIIDALDAGMVLLDKGRRVQWFNRQIEDWFDWKGTQRGQLWDQIIDESLSEQHTDIIQRTLQSGETHDYEWERQISHNSHRFFRLMASPIRAPDGTIHQVAIFIQDITARKAIEAQMMHTEKMAILGRMAAGIVHEIGNPIASLSTRLLLLETHREEQFVSESIGLLQKQIDRIKRIVRGVSEFSHFPKHEWALCQIETIVAETLDMLRMDSRSKDIQITTDIAMDLPPTTGAPDRLTQVFLNLGINALEALDGDGSLSISVTQRNNAIEVHFADSGPGIDVEVRERIFEPFFTTKREGSGLGLFISYSIINAHGGHIEVETSSDGTEISVVLPMRTDRKNGATKQGQPS